MVPVRIISISVALWCASAGAVCAEASGASFGEFPDVYPQQWCRAPDGKAFAVAFDREERRANVYSVAEQPDGRRLLSAVSTFEVPEYDPMLEPHAIVQQEGRRLVLYAVHGFDASPTSIALVVSAEGQAPIFVRRDRFDDPRQPNQPAAAPGHLRTPWLNEVVEITDDAIVVRTVEDALVKINLITGATAVIPTDSVNAGPVEANLTRGQCGAGLPRMHPIRYVCPDTFEVPARPVGLPSLGICQYDVATVLSDENARDDQHGNERRIVVRLLGKTYRLLLDVKPDDGDGLSDATGTVVFSNTRPNVLVRELNPRGSIKLLNGRIEGERKSVVSGVSGKSGLLSLEMVTSSDVIYVVRRSVLLPEEPDDQSLLAYRKSSIVIAAPAE